MKITFTLEELDGEIGISVDIPEEVSNDSELMQVAAHMFGSIKLKEDLGYSGSSSLH